MKKIFLIYISLLFLSLSAHATEPDIDIRYDGIYLNHITLTQLKKIYQDYKYKDYIYMPDWQYPPIFLQSMPIDFETIKDTQKRNKLFLQILIPLSLKLNEEITLERIEINELREIYNKTQTLTLEQIKFLEEKATKYDIFTKLKDNQRYTFFFDKLHEKVDSIPPSLLIASAAIESNWGTNRIATEANSLYREIAWYTNEGIKPQNENEDNNYRYKIFPSLYDSMKSYALKLNSDINYEMFRINRSRNRYKETPSLGRNIAHTLNSVSNLQNYAGILDYTITFYELINIDEAELAPLTLPNEKIKNVTKI